MRTTVTNTIGHRLSYAFAKYIVPAANKSQLGAGCLDRKVLVQSDRGPLVLVEANPQG